MFDDSGERLHAAEADGAASASAQVLALNAWLKPYAALADEKGMLRKGRSGDGLHPNANGYELMAPAVEAAIGKALGS